MSFKRFTWIEDDNFFDCIVGIVLDGEPVSTGVIVGHHSVITSASPLHHKQWTNPKGNLLGPNGPVKLYMVDGKWNIARHVFVDRVIGNQYDRNNHWVKVGLDSRHNTVYDHLFISIDLRYNNMTNWKPSWMRKPYRIGRAGLGDAYHPYGWKMAAFGYVDRDHVEESLTLIKTTYYSEDPLEDCDEWLPRAWGHFICLNNRDNFAGIQSGAALFNGHLLFGLGAFEVNKGNESILVFTDLRYVPHYNVWVTQYLGEKPK